MRLYAFVSVSANAPLATVWFEPLSETAPDDVVPGSRPVVVTDSGLEVEASEPVQVPPVWARWPAWPALSAAFSVHGLVDVTTTAPVPLAVAPGAKPVRTTAGVETP